MARRIETGPLIVAVGAIGLFVSTFLDWFAPGTSAWTAFEVLDLALAAIALAALLAAVGLLVPELAVLDRRWLGPLAIAALVIVASQIVNPPPAAGNGDVESGGWIGLAGALLMAAGALLSFSRVRFAVMVEGRDPRRRVSAVDARGGARSSAGAAGDEGPGAAPPAGAPAATTPAPREG
jgi:hypothetical protein